MYISDGSLTSLLSWFERPVRQGYSGLYRVHSFRFLCLLVAGHLNDSKFFQDVFDHQETLDVISGTEVAVFLFAKNLGSMFQIADGKGHAIRSVVGLSRRTPQFCRIVFRIYQEGA